MEEKTDALIEDLMSGLNTTLSKRFGKSGYKPVYNLNDDDAPINCRDFISTNSTSLDLAIANRKDGGIPVGRITEIAGLEASGKSLICAHLVKNTQDKGGLAVYIDTENAIFREFFQAVGVNLNAMLYVNVREIENILQGIEDTIVEIRGKNKTIPLTIIVDSYAGATAKSKAAEGYEKVGYNTDKALIMSDRLGQIADLAGRENVALVFTNQLRVKMDAMAFSDPYTTPGGKALPFYSSVRLRVKSATKLKATRNGVEEIVGIKTKVVVQKNRVGPPHRTAEFEIYFDSGVDDFGGVYQLAKTYKVIKGAGAWTNYTDKSTGEVLKFQGSNGFREEMIKNPEIYEKIKDEIADKYIMQYKKDTSVDTDSVTEDEELEL